MRFIEEKKRLFIEELPYSIRVGFQSRGVLDEFANFGREQLSSPFTRISLRWDYRLRFHSPRDDSGDSLKALPPSIPRARTNGTRAIRSGRHSRNCIA